MFQKRTLDNSYIDFGKEKFHFRTFFSLDTPLAFVSDIFMIPSALNALPPALLVYEKSFLIPVLKHWFFLLHSLMSEGILTSEIPRQPKYLISDLIFIVWSLIMNLGREMENSIQHQLIRKCMSSPFIWGIDEWTILTVLVVWSFLTESYLDSKIQVTK